MALWSCVTDGIMGSRMILPGNGKNIRSIQWLMLRIVHVMAGQTLD